MTQRNIDAMDMVVNNMLNGESLSHALRAVYSKRNVCIPYTPDMLNIGITKMGMSTKTTNTLMRAKLTTLYDVVEFCNDHKITEVKNMGLASGREVFEHILDHCWNKMDEKKREAFLIDVIERNEQYLKI